VQSLEIINKRPGAHQEQELIIINQNRQNQDEEKKETDHHAMPPPSIRSALRPEVKASCVLGACRSAAAGRHVLPVCDVVPQTLHFLESAIFYPEM